ncbi:protein FAM193B [Triplophysa dalaica]|uniref:protein FAM193B n=1 Tax=Triplophysa dalaica TaxID=1582913 RepID=UPI0024DF5BC6|nr:protein FAM193B [Triplophysa dalaica]
MARKKSKQQGVGAKDLASGQSLSKKPDDTGAAAAAAAAGGGNAGGGGDAGASRTNQSMHTCCLLCHREFKDWGAGQVNGLPSHGSKLAEAVPALSQALLREVPGRKLADAVPSLSQSLLGEVPLWICQSCRKSVEEEERRTVQEQTTQVPLSHSSSCKSQSCGNGYPEHSSVDWDPSSFLSARKLSGLWNSAHSNGGSHCNHSTSTLSQGGTLGPSCHEKRSSHDAPGKAAKTFGTKVCPYSHPASQNSSAPSSGTLSASSDLCKTNPKHFKTMCRRPTPPGEAFHPGDHHQAADLSVPPNSPTGLSSQHSSLLPPKQNSSQHVHVNTSSPGLASHAPLSPLVPNIQSPTVKHSNGADSPVALHKPSACKNSHIPAVNTQHGKLGNSLVSCSHPCNGHSNGNSVASSNAGHVTSGACRDQACKGHKMSNGSLCHAPPCELEEGEDEDSSSERSSCASSSTNQKDGKYCDCCYCEFFGHNAPPAAPTSRNYAEIREKLRTRLTRRKEELPQRQDLDPAMPSAIDNRDVDELLDFINSTEPKPVNSAKAAKRARHKQKKKEKALQGGVDVSNCDPRSASPSDLVEDSIPDGEANRLLEWPQLELERVNSFLTSRLEEIKNTIKDSIRASFSMYDLNLDVNDFPKKAATLEGNHLLSHLNGSSDLQQIDLDLAPLSLKNFKRDLDIINGWEDTTTAAKDIQRLHSTPSLSKLIRVRSPERCPAAGSESAPSSPAFSANLMDEIPETKTSSVTASKTKKAKKQQNQRQQELLTSDQAVGTKSTKNAPETQKTQETRSPDADKRSKAGLKQNQQTQQQGDSQKTVNKRAEESKACKQSSNGASNGHHNTGSNTHRGKNELSDTRGNRPEHDVDTKTTNTPNSQQQAQQPKGKSKNKNRNKSEKSNNAIDDVFLPKDLDPTEMDEIDREVEYFKRFCLDSAKQTRQKVAVNWSNFSLKKMPSNAAQ